VKVRTRLLLFGAGLPSVAMIVAVLLAGQAFRWSLMRSLDRALLAHAAVESVSLFDGPDGRPHLHMGKSPLATEVRSFAPVSGLFDERGVLVAHYPEGAEPPPRRSIERPAEPRLRTHVEPDGAEVRLTVVPEAERGPIPFTPEEAAEFAGWELIGDEAWAMIDGFALRSPLALTIPFSTSAGTMRYPAVIPVDSTPANGMPHDSFLLVFQLRATDRRRVRRRLGIIPPEVLSAVYQALDRLTGRPHPTGQP
jgi:mRNA-degrading endonuclease toxin of MazEF toxin-antitoxin module